MRSDDLSCGMVFRITDDCDSSTITCHHVALWNRLGCVIGSFGLNIWMNLADDSANVGLRKDYDRIDSCESGEDFCALVLGHHRTLFAFECSHRIVGVYGNHELSAEFFGGLQITHMSDMQKIEAAVGERDAFACALPSAARARSSSRVRTFAALLNEVSSQEESCRAR